MNAINHFPLSVPALKVTQPLGTFYLTRLPARVLLEVCYAERLSAVARSDGRGYTLDGIQRPQTRERLRSIAEYIETPEAAFPNSIILAANFRMEDGTVEEDSGRRWELEEGESVIATLKIPSGAKLASVIDGQHRLFAFNFADPRLLDTDLACSIYFDLPKAFQAYLFATINSNQKKVERSQTYELIGYNIEKEPEDSWTPPKLGVWLARKLNVDQESPLKGRILIAAENDFVLSKAASLREKRWMVSMATIVDGIVRLFSQNPKRDASRMLRDTVLEDGKRRKEASRSDLEHIPDSSPFRKLYIRGDDVLIYAAVLNFLKAAERTLWKSATAGSYITKTVGIQAQFDVLMLLAPEAISRARVSEAFFEEYLRRAVNIDFSGEAFRKPSGAGRSEIRSALIAAINPPVPV